MKKFSINCLIFLIIIVLIDYFCGSIFNNLVLSAKAGDTARNEFIANKMQAEILIFGSSRSIHHYDPTILEDSLNMSCYNCGQDGNGIILFYPRYKMITSRYTPKAIIYDVLYGFDLAKGDNHKYLDWLKIYYDYNGVDSVFWNVDKTEKYKMLSYMYRYNSKILQIIGDNLTTIREENKGYRPTDIIMDYEPQIQNEPAKYEIDSLKLYYIEKLIKECKKKHIQLIFSLSPFYGGSKYIDKDYAPLFKLMEKYKISFIDHYSDPDFIHNKLYFEDSYHMNRNGATAFSKKIAHELKQIIKSNEK